MNLNLYGHAGRWLMVDCGVTFNSPLTPQRSAAHTSTELAEVVTADPAFICDQVDNLCGIVITHAHEDHIGALPHLWPRFKCPVYTTPFTAEILRRKLNGTGLLEKMPIIEVQSGDTINIGGDWFNALRCSFGSPSPSCSGIRYDEPLYDHARPMLLASFLIANNFDAQPGRCGAVAEALGQSMGGEFSDFMFNGLGWSKGSSQVMHLMAHGAAIGDSCWNGGTAPVAPVIEDAILSDAGSSDSGTTEASPSQIEDETPPADETAPPPAAASGLPTSTYSLASGEVVDIYQGEGDYHMVMSHTIGSGTCFGSDWVLYDWYLAPSGGDFTQIGSTTEAESLDVNGHFLESQGCNKGTFLMSFNLPAGTHQGGVCITNRNNTQQRYCTSMPFTL